MSATANALDPSKYVEYAKLFGLWAAGAGSPYQQIAAGLIVFAFVIVSSAVSFGATLVLAPLAFIIVVVGVIRVLWYAVKGVL